MLYTTKDVKTAQDTPTYIPAGIHANLALVDVKYDTTPKNNEFLAFYFTNETGDTFSHTEWPVKLRKPVSAMSEEELELYRDLVEDQSSRIKQIIEAFISRGSYTDPEGIDFKTFAESVVKLLKDKINTTKVRVKIIYNTNNYTSFPRSPKYTFIEPMDVTQTKIRQLPNDQFVKKQPDVEVSRGNPFINELVATPTVLEPALESTTDIPEDSNSLSF